MASIRTKLTVGIFVLIGFAIAFIAVIWLGMSSQFEKGRYYAAYFGESVQGLSKDSPVKYRGVAVGRVNSIRVAPDATLIEVILKIETDLTPGDGMVAQLRSVGITGIMFMELDRKESGEPDQSPALSFKPDYPVVATKPSEISRLMESVDQVLDQFNAMDLPGISLRVKGALAQFEMTLSDLQAAQLSLEIQDGLDRWDAAVAAVEAAGKDLSRLTRDAGEAVGRIETTFAHADDLLIGSREEVQAALEEVRHAVGSADTLLAESAGLVRQGRQLVRQESGQLMEIQTNLSRSLDALGLAVENMNLLVEELTAHPSRLLFGSPPPARFPAEREKEGSR